MLYFMTLLKKNNYGLIIVILCLLLIPHGCLTLDHPSSYDIHSIYNFSYAIV